jgi:hypothetical protein
MEPIEPIAQLPVEVVDRSPRRLRITRRDANSVASSPSGGESRIRAGRVEVADRGGVRHKSGRGAAARRDRERVQSSAGGRSDGDSQSSSRSPRRSPGRDGQHRAPRGPLVEIHVDGGGGNPAPVPPAAPPAGPGNNHNPYDDFIGDYDSPEGMITDTDWTLVESILGVSWWWCVITAWLLLFGPLASGLWIAFFLVVGLHQNRRYQYGGRYHHNHLRDLRSDANSMLELRHPPRYGLVKVRRFLTCWGVDLHVPDFAWAVVGRARYVLYVSFEVVAQIATDTNMSLAAGNEVVWNRLNIAARSLHTINLDRFLALSGINVKQDSVLYCHALYKRMLQELDEDFPAPESQL